MSASPVSATINGRRTTSLVLSARWRGGWTVDAAFDELLAASDLTGAATVKIGASEFVGTFGPRTGSFQLQSRARIVAGAGGMGTTLKAKHYHSDAGVKAATVAADAVREAGETLGTSALTARIGVDFVRRSLPASQVLEQAIGSYDWWIDYAGAVQIGTRAAVETTAQFELLDFDPRLQVATIATDDPTAIVVGSILRQRLVTPILVRSVEVIVSGGKLRLLAWGGAYV